MMKLLTHTYINLPYYVHTKYTLLFHCTVPSAIPKHHKNNVKNIKKDILKMSTKTSSNI